jgi:hypothetical protein
MDTQPRAYGYSRYVDELNGMSSSFIDVNFYSDLDANRIGHNKCWLSHNTESLMTVVGQISMIAQINLENLSCNINYDNLPDIRQASIALHDISCHLKICLDQYEKKNSLPADLKDLFKGLFFDQVAIKIADISGILQAFTPARPQSRAPLAAAASVLQIDVDAPLKKGTPPPAPGPMLQKTRSLKETVTRPSTSQTEEDCAYKPTFCAADLYASFNSMNTCRDLPPSNSSSSNSSDWDDNDLPTIQVEHLMHTPKAPVRNNIDQKPERFGNDDPTLRNIVENRRKGFISHNSSSDSWSD